MQQDGITIYTGNRLMHEKHITEYQISPIACTHTDATTPTRISAAAFFRPPQFLMGFPIVFVYFRCVLKMPMNNDLFMVKKTCGVLLSFYICIGVFHSIWDNIVSPKIISHLTVYIQMHLNTRLYISLPTFCYISMLIVAQEILQNIPHYILFYYQV